MGAQAYRHLLDRPGSPRGWTEIGLRSRPALWTATLKMRCAIGRPTLGSACLILAAASMPPAPLRAQTIECGVPASGLKAPREIEPKGDFRRISFASVRAVVRVPNAQEQAQLQQLAIAVNAADENQHWAVAEEHVRAAMAIEERTWGPGHPHVLGSMNLIGKSLVQRDRPTEALALLQPALRLSFATLKDRNPLTASILLNLGDAYGRLGDLANAERSYERVLAMDPRVHGDQAEVVPETLVKLAVNLVNQGRDVEAEQKARRAVVISENRIRSCSTRARSYSAYAIVRNAQARFAEAEVFYDLALQVRQFALRNLDGRTTVTDRVARAIAFSNLAQNRDVQGRFEEATSLYQTALSILKQESGPDSLQTAIAYNNLAFNYRNLGMLDRAQENFFAARDILHAKLPRDHRDLASVNDNIGLNFDARGDHEEAARYFALALTARQRLGSHHPDVAATLLHQGENLRLRGMASQGEALIHRAVAIRRRAFGVDHPLLAAGLADHARLLAEQGPHRRARAMMLAREAVAIVRTRRAQQRSGQVVGDTASEDGQAIARAVGSDPAHDDPLRWAFGVLIQSAFLRAGDVSDEADALRDEAFQAAQDIHLSAAAETMAQTAARVAIGDDSLARLVRQQQDLSSQARQLGARLAASLDKPEEAQTLREALATVGASLSAVDRQLRADPRYSRYAELVSPLALSVAEVRRRLQPDEGLLLIVPVQQDLYSFSVSQGGVATWNRLAQGVAGVAERARLLRCQVDPATCHEGPVGTTRAAESGNTDAEARGYRAFDRAAAYALYRDLIAPVESGLTGARRIYVTVSGPLDGLPLAMLVTAEPPAGEDDADPAVLAGTAWLGERYAFTTLPSVSVLRVLSAVGDREGDGAIPFAGYGSPVLGRPSPIDSVPPVQQVDRYGMKLADPDAVRALPSLAGTEIELRNLAAVLGAGAGAVQLGPAATEAAIRADTSLAYARVVAFATHGLKTNELRGFDQPGLVFTPPATASESDDGILSAAEASRMTLSAEWLILSACNTASPDGQSRADSLSSLSRSFLYAGAQALLASNWRVDDAATAALTVETLNARIRMADLTRAQAHAEAQSAIRTGHRRDGSAITGWSPSWSHPAYWAPFSVIAAEDR